MTVKPLKRAWLLLLVGLGVLWGGPAHASAGNSAAGGLDFTRLIPEALPRSVVFEQPGWCLWDPCVVRGDDGLFYLYYSRWRRALGYDAWCTHAEIAWATSKAPEGPYEFKGVALAQRGGGYWDGHAVYNTCVIRWRGKYYLYYTGNHGTSRWSPSTGIPMASADWWVHRNNQRIGVAVADHPEGPWTRSDTPLIDTGEGFGQTIVNVPNAVVRPDGGVRLYYKTLAPGEGKYGGGVFHYGADGPGPLGPFVRYPEPMVDKNRLMPTVHTRFNFHIDDHFEWIQDGRYYAIVKDHDAPFLTDYGRSLLLFDSADGRTWKPSEHILVKDFTIRWSEGGSQRYSRLEMPKLLIQNGRPVILSLAALPVGEEQSYLVIIPLLK